MVRWLYTLTAVAALIGTGLVHGFWTNRWVEDHATKQAADRLTTLPMSIGEWEGTQLDIAPGPGIAGSVQRSYVNRRLGVTVNIALVNGQPGPVATHTPEVCYGASGFTVGKRTPMSLDTQSQTARFWTTDASRARATDETRLRLYWAWNAGKGWVASEDARQEFPRFRYPVLHKLYVIRELSPFETHVRDKDEACVQFLRTLVPVLDEKMFKEAS